MSAPVGSTERVNDFQDPRRSLEPVGPPSLGAQLEQSGAHRCRDLATELGVVVLGNLALDDNPTLTASCALEAPQEHRLADTPKAGDDHGLFRAPPGHALQQDIEGRYLVVSADDSGGLRAGVRRVGVAGGVHVVEISDFIGL